MRLCCSNISESCSRWRHRGKIKGLSYENEWRQHSRILSQVAKQRNIIRSVLRRRLNGLVKIPASWPRWRNRGTLKSLSHGLSGGNISASCPRWQHRGTLKGLSYKVTKLSGGRLVVFLTRMSGDSVSASCSW
jgi:hypothetical protein